MTDLPLTTVAAILTELKKPLMLCELKLPSLMPGQVLVEVAYSGVCFTQVLEARGLRGADPFLPHCLGHEGSGKVIAVAPGVTRVKPDQNVILSWIKASGADIPGTKYEWDGKIVNSGAVTTFSRFTIVSENRVTQLPDEIPLDQAALLGCAVATGCGSVFNTAAPRAGESVIIFGMGGVGLCSVMAAKAIGCSYIIAVDVVPKKLELARECGATHALNAIESDVQVELAKLLPRGADYAIEATGRTTVMQQALLSVRNQGGAVVIVGNAPSGQLLEIDPKQFNLGKQMRGTWGGDTVPDRDFNRYFKLFTEKALPLDKLITDIYSLSEVNAALDKLERGETFRPLIDLSKI